jgi:hypothetical protein
MTGTEDDSANDTPVSEADLVRAGALLRSAMPSETFASGFADRTMARLDRSRGAASVGSLRIGAMQRSFRMLSAAAAVIIVALGVHNTVISPGANATLVESAIGLEPVSAESVLSYTSEVFQ